MAALVCVFRDSKVAIDIDNEVEVENLHGDAAAGIPNGPALVQCSPAYPDHRPAMDLLVKDLCCQPTFHQQNKPGALPLVFVR